ncbi:MAG: pilus assembly protein TadG-related protein [Pseudomonadota bacterium]
MKTMLPSGIVNLHVPHRMWVRLRQGGSIAVIAAIGISIMVISLASIDIGYLFFQKRELQKVADLSALAGAQQLIRSSALTNDNCSSAFDVVRKNADAQTVQKYTETTLLVSCGRWDPAAATHYTAYSGGVTPSGSPAPTAVSVWVSATFNSFFGVWASREVSAAAIATADSPIAVFSVESRLLRIKDGTVPKLLTDLGVDIKGTSLLSYDGLANAKVTPGGLLKNLGFEIPLTVDVATIKNLIAIGSPKCPSGICPLNTLLGEVSSIGGQSDLINALGIQSGPVKLVTDGGGKGLLTILDIANGKSVLEANIKSAELLSTAIVIANSAHPPVSADISVTVPGRILTVDSKIGIVEPPSIGIGGKGTTAVTSQVRIFVQAKSNLLNASLLTADIPLAIDVVNGVGTITDMCTKKRDGKDVATIKIDAPILKLCVGNLNAGNAFSKSSTCSDNLQDYPLITLLGKEIKTSLFVNALPNTAEDDFVKGQTISLGKNNLQLDATIKNLMDALIAKLLGTILDRQGQINGDVSATNLASSLLNSTNNVLDTATSTVKDALALLKNFVNSVNANASLVDVLGGVLTGLLNTVGSLVTGLTNAINNILLTVVCLLGSKQDCLATQLSGNQGSLTKVLLTVLGLVTDLLKPVLDALGTAISNQLQALLGIELGQVDVTLIDLNCGGGSNVRLVY